MRDAATTQAWATTQLGRAAGVEHIVQLLRKAVREQAHDASPSLDAAPRLCAVLKLLPRDAYTPDDFKVPSFVRATHDLTFLKVVSYSVKDVLRRTNHLTTALTYWPSTPALPGTSFLPTLLTITTWAFVMFSPAARLLQRCAFLAIWIGRSIYVPTRSKVVIDLGGRTLYGDVKEGDIVASVPGLRIINGELLLPDGFLFSLLSSG